MISNKNFILTIALNTLLSTLCFAGNPDYDFCQKLLAHRSGQPTHRTYSMAVRELNEISKSSVVFEKKLYDASLRALEQYQKEKKPAPAVYMWFSIGQSMELEIKNAWLAWVSKHSHEAELIGSTLSPVKVRTIAKNQQTHVIALEVDRKKKVFRKIQNPEIVNPDESKTRKTLAASILNQLLGLSSVPLAKLAVVNGEIGILSDWADGNQVSIDDNKTISAKYKADITAFEFLTLNYDAAYENVLGLKVIDHDVAFRPGIHNEMKKNHLEMLYDKSFDEIKRLPFILGETLPEKYSNEFIEKLKNLTPEKILSTFKDILHPIELDALIFRRAIILQDIQLRGNEALLPKKST